MRSPKAGEVVGHAASILPCDLLLTADNNMRYPQNFTGRKIALVVLSTPQSPRVQLHVDEITAVLNSVRPGSYCQIEIPYARKV